MQYLSPRGRAPYLSGCRGPSFNSLLDISHETPMKCHLPKYLGSAVNRVGPLQRMHVMSLSNKTRSPPVGDVWPAHRW